MADAQLLRDLGGTRLGRHTVCQGPLPTWASLGPPLLPAYPWAPTDVLLQHCAPRHGCGLSAHGRPHWPLPPASHLIIPEHALLILGPPPPTQHLQVTSGCTCLGPSTPPPPQGSQPMGPVVVSWGLQSAPQGEDGRAARWAGSVCAEPPARRGLPMDSGRPLEGRQETFSQLPHPAPLAQRLCVHLTLFQLRLWDSLGSCSCSWAPKACTSARSSTGHSRPGPILITSLSRTDTGFKSPCPPALRGHLANRSLQTAWKGGEFGPSPGHRAPALGIQPAELHSIQGELPAWGTLRTGSPGASPLTVSPLGERRHCDSLRGRYCVELGHGRCWADRRAGGLRLHLCAQVHLPVRVRVLSPGGRGPHVHHTRSDGQRPPCLLPRTPDGPAPAWTSRENGEARAPSAPAPQPQWGSQAPCPRHHGTSAPCRLPRPSAPSTLCPDRRALL